MASEQHSKRIDQFIDSCLADDSGKLSQSAVDVPNDPTNEELGRLDAELSWFEDLEKAFQVRIRAKYARAASQRNTLIGIHKLPLEIISWIIELSLDHFGPEPERNTTDRLLVLQTVCHRWKEVLDQSPSLWGWIDQARYVRYAVVKSKNAPLWIDIANECLYRLQLERVLDILLPHAQRWKALRLWMPGEVVKLCDQLLYDASAPSLQVFGLVAHGVYGYGIPEIRAIERFNKIQHLELSALTLHWDTIADMKGLRSLIIGDANNTVPPPSPEQISEVLLGCPLLEKLAISNYSDINLDFTSPVSTYFHLPSLKCLTLKGIIRHKGLLLWLLESISAPNLVALVVRAVYNADKVIARAILEALQQQRRDAPFPTVAKSIQSPSVQLCVNNRETTLQWGLQGSHGTFPSRGIELYLPGINYIEEFDRLLDFLAHGQHTCVIDLLLIREQYTISPNPHPNFIGRISSLSILRLEGVHNTEDLLEYLCHRGVEGLPCPNLKELRIVGHPSGAQVDDALKESLRSQRPEIAFYCP